ncbi:TetR/AcrR family transcriptional regulator [Afifella marina]|uniref:Transcriptional regulator, TetR family n=1 Tax=Afifella marina DSM 2698 TaxID=1120955 RepID=A0A1G5NWZ9_AFIMA|nr:TetR/AcrR family transcriptional regulator [Afifella marina]MBK1624459.1 TetR/AcrR family transcriptional regulator [Afifella marina DSM 2698]MBK1628191.1 TetR/AcrR family transcriptional regulator [Afifella marina]MBK5916625.1 TetR family transcriptional regulator [Afifella marina]RAI18980.1 TetR family transcriptional regulator [Afifella marina DSM 2698]SCZ41872.1 transcriptional regulator, TetR family [Afifella marina DSM 2698]
METKTRLLAAAEQLFDLNGFTATGMDRLTQTAGMSTRTLYKHAGSKTNLMAAVLAERDLRFMRTLEGVESVDGIFAALETWMREEGARGCLFLRAFGETGGNIPEVRAAVLAHKESFRKRLAEILVTELGEAAGARLAEEILVLYEGATAASVYRGPAAVAAARRAAAILVADANAGQRP